MVTNDVGDMLRLGQIILAFSIQHFQLNISRVLGKFRVYPPKSLLLRNCYLYKNTTLRRHLFMSTKN